MIYYYYYYYYEALTLVDRRSVKCVNRLSYFTVVLICNTSVVDNIIVVVVSDFIKLLVVYQVIGR